MLHFDVLVDFEIAAVLIKPHEARSLSSQQKVSLCVLHRFAAPI